jgi:hypothetical protein
VPPNPEQNREPQDGRRDNVTNPRLIFPQKPRGDEKWHGNRRKANNDPKWQI